MLLVLYSPDGLRIAAAHRKGSVGTDDNMESFESEFRRAFPLWRGARRAVSRQTVRVREIRQRSLRPLTIAMYRPENDGLLLNDCMNPRLVASAIALSNWSASTPRASVYTMRLVTYPAGRAFWG